jgi:hypothetical protein
MSRGANVVSVNVSKELAKNFDLSFLAELPGLVGIEINGSLRNDGAVFELPNLELLGLFTKSRSRIFLERLPRLRDLAVAERPGLSAVELCQDLLSLSVGSFRSADLTFLGSLPALETLRIEARKQRLALDGVQHLDALQHLSVFDARVLSLKPLASLTQMRSLLVTGIIGASDDVPLDLDDIGSAASLRELRITAPVLSLSPLARFPALQAVGFGSTVIDGDLSPLLALPPDVIVGAIGNHPNHSHTEAQIQQMRDRLK